MAAASASGVGAVAAASGVERVISGAEAENFEDAKAETFGAAVGVASSGAVLARAVVGLAVAVPTSNVAVVVAVALQMFNVAGEAALAVTSNAVVAVAAVTPNRVAAAAEERLLPAAVAVGALTDRPTAIRSSRPLIGQS